MNAENDFNVGWRRFGPVGRDITDYVPHYPSTPKIGWPTGLTTIAPFLPDERFADECRRLREGRAYRERVEKHTLPIFLSLPPDVRAKASRDYANTLWQERILRARLVRLYKYPPEIVVHVLGFLLDENPDLYRFRLAAVCRQWREIVVKMPRLWQELWLNDVRSFYPEVSER